MNIHAQIFMWTYVFNSKNGIVRSHGNYVLTPRGSAQLFLKVAVPFYISTSTEWRFQFLHILPKICCCAPVVQSHLTEYESMHHCGFDLTFSNY